MWEEGDFVVLNIPTALTHHGKTAQLIKKIGINWRIKIVGTEGLHLSPDKYFVPTGVPIPKPAPKPRNYFEPW